MKQIVISSLYLLVLLALHFIFDKANLYYELRELDIPMHILGGFGIASLASAVFSYFGKTVSLWNIFIAYTVVAIAWELYEYVRDINAGRPWNGWPDTLSDYANGAVGMAAAYFLMKKK